MSLKVYFNFNLSYETEASDFESTVFSQEDGIWRQVQVKSVFLCKFSLYLKEIVDTFKKLQKHKFEVSFIVC